MSEPDLFSWQNPKQPARKQKGAHEWKIVSLRETASVQPDCVTPFDAVEYWRAHVAKTPQFNPDVECLAVLLLNIRKRIRGHHIVSIGGLNETVAHPREVFRAAIIGAAWGIVLMHNHPSGDATPSDADIRVTRRISEVGQILQITLVDHIIVGEPGHVSLRESGLVL